MSREACELASACDAGGRVNGALAVSTAIRLSTGRGHQKIARSLSVPMDACGQAIGHRQQRTVLRSSFSVGAIARIDVYALAGRWIFSHRSRSTISTSPSVACWGSIVTAVVDILPVSSVSGVGIYQ